MVIPPIFMVNIPVGLSKRRFVINYYFRDYIGIDKALYYALYITFTKSK